MLTLPEELPITPEEKTETSGEPTPAEEENSWGKPASSSSDSWEKPAKTEENPIVPTPHAHTRPEYIAMYNGLCPSQQPQDSTFWEDTHYQAAIGAYTKGYNLRSVLEQEWEYNKSGRWGVEGVLPVDTFWNLHITDGDKAGYYTYIYIDWDTYESWWYNEQFNYDRTNYAEKIGEPYPAEWDEAVAEATRYLHYLEDTYNAHCPND